MSDITRRYADDEKDHGLVLSSNAASPMPLRYAETRNATVSEPEADDLVALIQYLRVLWKHKWSLLLSAVLGCVAGLAIVLETLPMYQAATSIEIQNIQ